MDDYGIHRTAFVGSPQMFLCILQYKMFLLLHFTLCSVSEIKYSEVKMCRNTVLGSGQLISWRGVGLLLSFFLWGGGGGKLEQGYFLACCIAFYGGLFALRILFWLKIRARIFYFENISTSPHLVSTGLRWFMGNLQLCHLFQAARWTSPNCNTRWLRQQPPGGSGTLPQS